MTDQTLWRRLLYSHLSKTTLSGKVIDLGGSKQAEYHALIGGKPDITVVNIDEGYGYDLCFDLEKEFPVKDASYDGALCLNVLEHVYRNDILLKETFRILVPGGKLVLGVPFLFQVHPCPHDYFRYTGETLERMFFEAGFKEVVVIPIGTGPFGAAAQILYNVLHFSFLRRLAGACAQGIDTIVSRKKGYGAASYPLGYVVTAKKPESIR